MINCARKGCLNNKEGVCQAKDVTLVLREKWSSNGYEGDVFVCQTSKDASNNAHKLEMQQIMDDIPVG